MVFVLGYTRNLRFFLQKIQVSSQSVFSNFVKSFTLKSIFMKTGIFFIFAFMLAIATGCSGQGKAGGSNAEVNIPEPSGDEIRETGRVKSVEDSGYPFVNLTIEFPERKFEETFVLNLESVEGVDPAVVNSWKGKYVAFNYFSTISNMLFDLHLEGASLMGMTETELPEGVQKFSGVLSGAGEVTGGDLPSLIKINDPHGELMEFECFVTEEMTQAEGQLVEAFFEARTQNDISAIVLLKK